MGGAKKMRRFFKYITILFIIIGAGCASFQLKTKLYKVQNIINNGSGKDILRAERTLLELLPRYPQNPKIHLLLGITYYYERRWKESQEELDRAILLGSKSYLPHYYKGIIYYINGEYEEAKEELDQAIKVTGSQNICIPEIYKVMGSMYEIMDTPYPAIALYKKALSCPMEDKNPYERNSFKAELYERLGIIFEKLAQKALNRGNEEESEKKVSQAKKFYLKAIKLYPTEAIYFMNLATLYLWQPEIREALSYFRKAAIAANNSGETTVLKESYFYLGYLSQKIGERLSDSKTLKKALIMYNYVKSLDPNYRNVTCRIGRIYFLIGEKQKAYKELSECCENPSGVYEIQIAPPKSIICKTLYVQLKKTREVAAISPIKTSSSPEPLEIRTENINAGRTTHTKVEVTEMENPQAVELSKETAYGEKNTKRQNIRTKPEKAQNGGEKKKLAMQTKENKTLPLTQRGDRRSGTLTQKLPSKTIKQKPLIPQSDANLKSKIPSSNKTKKKKIIASPLIPDIDTGISNIDSLLAQQGSIQKKEGIEVGGMRKKATIQNVDIDIEAEEGKQINLKKETKKIEAQIKLNTSGENRGTLDPRVISQAIASHYGEVRYCYEKQLKIHPELEGKLMVKFTIGESGRVRSAIVTESTINNIEVESCVLYKIKGWRFPPPQGGEVSVIFPFIFMGGG